MIERIRLKYEDRWIKSPVPTSSRKDFIKDALGAQSIKMRKDGDDRALREAGMVWQRHRVEEKQCWQDWTQILGPALVKVQDEAMAVASVNKPEGKRYARVVSGLLKTYNLDGLDSATRSHAIAIVQNLELVTYWRAKQKKPERLNHPTTVWRSFALSEEWRAVQSRHGIKPKERRSPPRPIKKQLEALQAELGTTRADYERVNDECQTLRSKLEANNVAAPAMASEDYNNLSIPDFLDRTDRCGALATLLTGKKLTLKDVPIRTTHAALVKLANELSDLAAALLLPDVDDQEV